MYVFPHEITLKNHGCVGRWVTSTPDCLTIYPIQSSKFNFHNKFNFSEPLTCATIMIGFVCEPNFSCTISLSYCGYILIHRWKGVIITSFKLNTYIFFQLYVVQAGTCILFSHVPGFMLMWDECLFCLLKFGQCCIVACSLFQFVCVMVCYLCRWIPT